MNEALIALQVINTCLMTMLLAANLKIRGPKNPSVDKNAQEKREKLKGLNKIALSTPLTELARPAKMEDVVGQDEGIRALCAALCGKNPQHIIIYGPPGVGKTCAARLALELAKESKNTPFRAEAQFVEVDATCVRFDERSIADPLIGSVHDPIYQGAGAYGQSGIPQPKPGAVTKAHGGVLFLDEIGELHPMQMNKLLKVMEDRRVYFESAYYDASDKNIPQYIHDIFKNGMPADFRLIGATTRRPEELPAALRSRAIEIFFKPLQLEELISIARSAARTAGMAIEPDALETAASCSGSGREAVSIVQMSASMADAEGRSCISGNDVKRVLEAGGFERVYRSKVSPKARVGVVNALGVAGSVGVLIEIEAAVEKAVGNGTLRISGVAESETIDAVGRQLTRKSTAFSSVQNVLSALKFCFGLNTDGYDIYVNVRGGALVDGPSAGLALAVCIYSAMTGEAVPGNTAFTGEIGLHGDILPVGGVRSKVRAAKKAGADIVYIPEGNSESAEECIAVSHVKEVIHGAASALRCEAV